MATKRKNGTGLIRQRSDGRWEGRVIKSYDENKKPKYASVFGKTQAECKRKLNELIEALKFSPGRTSKVKSTMLFGEWMDFWYNYYCKPSVKENTRNTYSNTIYKHIVPMVGDIPLNKLTQMDLVQFFNEEKQSGRKKDISKLGEGVSDDLIRSCFLICNKALNKAVSENLIPKNILKGYKPPSKNKTEMKILTHEEIQRFLIQANHDGYYEIFLLELATGLRRGELVGLQVNDFNFKENEITIVRQVIPSKGGIAIESTKTKSSNRTISIPPEVSEILEEFIKHHKSKWMFPSPVDNSKPLNPLSVNRKCRKILERANCKQVRFHDLRHTFATLSLENGMDIKTLSSMIGHSTVATTLDVYSHISDEMLSSAALKIDGRMGRAITESGNDALAQASKMAEDHTVEFTPREGKIRKSGTGCLYQVSENSWEGKYSPTNADGKRVRYTVYAKTKAECEIKLQEMIAEKKAEIAEAKKRKISA